MNHILDQSTVKNSRESKASAYCRRNNINEYQFQKAIAWYRSAIQNQERSKKLTQIKKHK
jgi:hypothetical protein